MPQIELCHRENGSADIIRRSGTSERVRDFEEKIERSRHLLKTIIHLRKRVFLLCMNRHERYRRRGFSCLVLVIQFLEELGVDGHTAMAMGIPFDRRFHQTGCCSRGTSISLSIYTAAMKRTDESSAAYETVAKPPKFF